MLPTLPRKVFSVPGWVVGMNDRNSVVRVEGFCNFDLTAIQYGRPGNTSLRKHQGTRPLELVLYRPDLRKTRSALLDTHTHTILRTNYRSFHQSQE